MTDNEIIIEIAKLDGITSVYTKEIKQHYPAYLTSYDAIIPVVKKQDLTEEQWEALLRALVPDEKDWIACNTIWRDKNLKLRQSRLPRAYRLLILASPRQLCEALLKSTGKWKE